MALTSKLSAIGEAIRAKTGKTEKLTLDEMPQEIQSIQGGGSGTDTLLDYVLEKTCKVVSDEVTELRDYLFYKASDLVELNLPNLKTLNAYSISSTGVTSLEFPKLEAVAPNSIQSNRSLKSINFPNLICRSNYGQDFGCGYNDSLTVVNIPKVKYLSSTGFTNNLCLERLDLPSVIKISNVSYLHPFGSCYKLTVLILRSNQVVELTDSKDLFANCPINNGGYLNQQGYIYVPKALLEDYKVATNWSVYADGFRAIEDYPDICGEVS